MPTIPSRIASDLISATGITCIRTVTLPGHPGFTRIIVGDFADGKAKGERMWFRSRTRADKILTEILVWNRRTRRSGAALIIETDTAEAIKLVRERVDLLGYRAMTDADLDACVADVTKRTETAMETMRRNGTMKRLNRLYAALDQEKPTYSDWLVDRLRGEIARFADFTGMLLTAA